MIRILVVDDHPVVRAGLVMMLGTQADMEVVGEASDGQEAVKKVAALTPDVVLAWQEVDFPNTATRWVRTAGG